MDRRQKTSGKKTRRKNPLSTSRRASKKYRKYERRLERLGLDMVRDFQKAIKQYLVPRVNELAESYKNETFIMQDNVDRITLERILETIAATTFTTQSKQELGVEYAADLERLILQVSPDNLNALAISENLQRVMSESSNNTVQALLREQRELVANTQLLIGEGVQRGERWETIAKSLSGSIEGDAYRSAANRAKFIARNEVTTALGEINREQQAQAGIQLYRWQTAEDERVRATHRELDQKIFTWGNAAITIDGKTYEPASDPTYNAGAPTIPGQPWNCRCVGLPYIIGVDDE